MGETREETGPVGLYLRPFTNGVRVTLRSVSPMAELSADLTTEMARKLHTDLGEVLRRMTQ
jgi:hypothetical protein